MIRNSAEVGSKISAFVMDGRGGLDFREYEIFQESDAMKLIPKYEALRERQTHGIENRCYKPFDDPQEIEMALYAHFNAEHPEQGFILEPQKRSDTEFRPIHRGSMFHHVGDFM